LKIEKGIQEERKQIGKRKTLVTQNNKTDK
jgi:hypothetical protein